MIENNFVLTIRAEQDIKDIWLHIARDNITAADNVIESFEKAFFRLVSNPNIGSIREDLTDKAVRFWVVYSYYIIYDPDTNPLQILRVVSSYRNISNQPH